MITNAKLRPSPEDGPASGIMADLLGDASLRKVHKRVVVQPVARHYRYNFSAPCEEAWWAKILTEKKE